MSRSPTGHGFWMPASIAGDTWPGAQDEATAEKQQSRAGSQRRPQPVPGQRTPRAIAASRMASAFLMSLAGNPACRITAMALLVASILLSVALTPDTRATTWLVIFFVSTF